MVEIILNTKPLESLPADQQQAIKQAAMNALEAALAKSEELDAKALADAEKRGVKVLTISPEEMKRFREAVKPLWDAEAKKSTYSAKLVQILRDHLKSKGID